MHEVVVCTSESAELIKAPVEIKLLPLGEVHSQKGDFIVDGESFDLIQRQFKERALDLVIDYEHQTLKDVQAPAAGWVKELTKGKDAILAKVEWTPKAKEYLANKEYRYLSPVVLVRKNDKKAVALHSAALTNTPAIDGMFAIVNKGIPEEGEIRMELSEIAKLLGLEETATEEEVRQALEAVKKKQDETEEESLKLDTITSLLGLKGEAKTEDVAASIMELKNAGESIKTEVKVLKEKLAKKEADEAVELALKAGKISAAQKEWAQDYALKDLEGFSKFVDKAPQVVPVGKLDLKDDKNPPVKEEDSVVKVLKSMGFTEEEIKKGLGKE